MHIRNVGGGEVECSWFRRITVSAIHWIMSVAASVGWIHSVHNGSHVKTGACMCQDTKSKQAVTRSKPR